MSLAKWQWANLIHGPSQGPHCLKYLFTPTPRLSLSPTTLEESRAPPTQLCLNITHPVVLALKPPLLDVGKYIPNKM